MTHQDDDETDLRRTFAALRREDTEKAPSFEALLAGAPSVRGHRRGGLVPLLSGLAAVSLVTVVLAVWTVRHPAPAPMASMAQWTAPTDFLLKTPGREILETVPRFGIQPPLALPRGASGRGPSPRPRSVLP
jgi:hypothetical protein